jgi:hypothetical protein
VCRAAAGGICDAAETCTGASAACPPDGAAPAGQVCRAAAGPCDAAEVCDGTANTCPLDQFVPLGTLCRASVGQCDQDDFCSGAAAFCVDNFVNPGDICRPSTGPCDAAELCSGAAGGCPPDGLLPAGAECRPAVGSCDVAEICDGTTNQCPANTVLPAGQLCRGPVDICDVAELCNGTDPFCPTNGSSPAGSICRPATDVCDVADACSGVSPSCPNDRVADAAALCRGPAGACDNEELCSGFAKNCPPDQFTQSGVCRPAVGVCDVSESCDGLMPQCPADLLDTAGTVCRAALSSCDVTEACSGVSAMCPLDSKQPDGTGCEDGYFCTANDFCMSGACIHGLRNHTVCTDNNVCNGIEQCDPAYDRGDHTGCNDPEDLACDLCTTELLQGEGPVCNPISGCVPDARPRAACEEPTVARTDLIRNPFSSFDDKLKFKWIGQFGDRSRFGEPRFTTRYALCYYDGQNALVEPEYAATFSVGPDSFHWKKALSGKLTYNESFGEQSGVTKMLLFSNEDGKTRLKVKGKGDALTMPEPIDENDFFMVQDEVVAQIVNDQGRCWEARFGQFDVLRNLDTRFKAKGKQ